MANSLIKKIKLENGLNLEFYDSSKKIAGDRWQVKLTVRVEIPVNDYLQNIEVEMNVDDVKKILGKSIYYEKNMVRNFIDNKEKEKLLKGFCDSFLKSTLSYLSEPNFPKRFIVKNYNEYKSRKGWYQS